MTTGMTRLMGGLTSDQQPVGLDAWLARVNDDAALVVSSDGRVVLWKGMAGLCSTVAHHLGGTSSQYQQWSAALAAAMKQHRLARGYSEDGRPVPPVNGCRVCSGRGYLMVPAEPGHPFQGQLYQQLCVCKNDLLPPEYVNPNSHAARLARMYKAGLPDRGVQLGWTLESWAGQVAAHDADKAVALAVASEYAAGPYPFSLQYGGRTGLLFTGGYGTGKSGLMYAVAVRLLTQHRVDLCWMGWQDIITQLKDAWAGKTGADRLLLDKLRRVEVLCLDDLGDGSAEAGADWLRSQAEDILLTRYNHRMKTMVTTNLTQQQMAAQVGGRLADRLWGDWMVACHVGGTSLRGHLDPMPAEYPEGADDPW